MEMLRHSITPEELEKRQLEDERLLDAEAAKPAMPDNRHERRKAAKLAEIRERIKALSL